MRRFSLLFILMGLLLCSCFSGSSLLFLESDSHNLPNLLMNGNFERLDKQNPNTPLSWYIISSSAGEVEPVIIDSTVSIKGHSSFRINKSPHNIFIVSDAFKINYTGGYYIKGFIKSAKTMRKPTKIYFWAYDANGNKKNNFRRSVKASTDWKKAEISAGFLKNQTSFARIAIFIPKDASNTVWLDDFGCYWVHKFVKE